MSDDAEPSGAEPSGAEPFGAEPFGAEPFSAEPFYATPTLMRAARGVYAQAVRVQLQAIGVEDLPRNGAFVLTGIDNSDGSGPRRSLSRSLGVTKQAVSQLVETLVNLGYVERGPDPDDRRRVDLRLTDRGREVVDVVGRAVEHVDEQLCDRVSADNVQAMRAALLALAEIKADNLDTDTGIRRPPRPPRQLRQFSPIFSVRDLPAALAHYTALGFTTTVYDDGAYDDGAYDGGADYGFADRDGTGLHLAVRPGHDPDRDGAVAYLYVHDADALYDEWTKPGIGGLTRPVGPTPYDLREGSHVDPDGNVIRFGSPMPEPAPA